MTQRQRTQLMLTCAAGALLLGAGSATAQTQPRGEGVVVEELVVTAGKREQTLQDVPVSVGVVTGDTIKELAITNLDELSTYVPGLVIQEGGEQTGISIRGFGASLNFGIDQSVGLFVDEVYAGRERQFRGTFLDVERIEVLKGPQGTLFGKNTIAGAVTITSGTPTHDPMLSVRGEYSPDTNLRAVEAVINGPIVSDVLAGRLAVRWADEDGYMYNTLTGEREEQETDKIIRGTLLWTPTDRLRVRAKAEWSEYERIGRAFSISEISGLAVGRPMISSPTTLLPLPAPVDVGIERRLSTYQFYDPQFDYGLNFTTSKQRETSHVEYQGAVIDARYDLGPAELRSITGYNAYESNDQRDVDWSPMPYLYEPITQEFSQWSQEFRLVSDVGEHFDYIAGLYWFKSDFFVDRRTDVDVQPFYLVNPPGTFFNPFTQLLGPPVPALRYANLRYLDQTAETYSAYGQATWHIIPDRLHLTAGLRWMRETKKATDRLDQAEFGTTRYLDPANNPADAELLAVLRTLNLNQAAFATAHSFQGENTEENVIPEAKLSWDVTDDVMLYASATKGYKGGGFNSQSSTQNEDDDFRFEPEEVVGYEFGGKLRLFDRRMNVNFALFRQDFENLQLSTWTGSGFFLTNAGSARSQGVEGDFTWQVSERLRLNGAFTLLDSTYTESVYAACNIGQLNFGQEGCFLIPAPTAANPAATRPVQDLNGKRFAAKYSYTIGGAYVQPLGDDVELMLRADAQFRARGQYALDPTLVQPAYELLDLSATFRSTDAENPWYAGVTVTNVFDERRYFMEFEAPAQVGTRIGFPAPGRMATFRVGYQW